MDEVITWLLSCLLNVLLDLNDKLLD